MNPVSDAVARGADALTGRCENPRREAELLLVRALGLGQRADLVLHAAAPTQAELHEFERLVNERASGKPLQYVLGWAPFYEGRFAVGPGVFIPRPETERLVAVALELWGPTDRTGRILDLGVGSGAILVSLLAELSGARGYGIDLSRPALGFAAVNAERHGVSDRIHLACGDLFEPLRPEARFDLVVSNPPYVALGEALPPEVRDHEPEGALMAGEDGLDVIRRLAAGAPAGLRRGGWLVLEIGERQGEAVRLLLSTGGAYTDIRILQDLCGRDRVAIARSAG